MQSITSTWFECAIKYERTTEDGAQQKVTETYVVEALSFTEAENKIIEEMTPYINGELEIKKISPMTITEIFFSDNDKDDKWYKCKLTFITIDEKNGKEKKSSTSYLVQADSLASAFKYMEDEMNKSMTDYSTSNVSETKIMDVYRH